MNLFKSITRGGLGAMSKTAKLTSGMTTSEVKDLLGNPVQTEFVAEKLVWKYTLHQWMKGWVPFYLVFGGKEQLLESWHADEAEYLRNQQMWINAFNQNTFNQGGSSNTENSLDIEIMKNKAWHDSGAGNWS